MLAGYSGYTPAFRTVPPAPAPGTENNDRKFQSAGKSVVYPDQPLSRLMNEPRLSVSSDQSAYLAPTDYKTPDPRGVMAARLDAATANAAAPRRFVHRSAKDVEFPDFWQEKRQALNMQPESYRVRFDQVAVNGTCSVIQAVRLFGDAQVASASLRYQNLFERVLVQILQRNLTQRNAASKDYVPTLASGELRLGLVEVSFAEFSEAVTATAAQLGAVSIGPSEPSALYAAKLDPKVITSLTENSRYMSDLGEAGVVPVERGVMTGYGGMASTTNDLMYGTAKLSNQVPGYSGHIPKAGGRPTLQPPRPDQKKSVKGCFNANLPGYTGHWPTYGMTAKTEGVSVSIETTTGSSQALAAALAVGSDWKKAI